MKLKYIGESFGVDSLTNGKIYDASSGRYWSSCAKLLQNGILKVRGFWKVEWIGKSISFKKVA